MINVLIGGQRKEVGKLFEMLLWQPDRNFSNAYSLDRCIKQVKIAPPDLLIIDSSIDTPERCFGALAELKETQATADIPIVLLTDPRHDCEERSRLMLVADDHIPEPFNPGEIKSIAEQFI
jgi:DNA-binding response OmpR family regulator